MVTHSSTTSWKRIDRSILDEIELSTGARELTRGHWPGWAAGSSQFNRILAYSCSVTSDTTLSSTEVVAALLTERLDPKDAPQIYNYNFYLIAETTDGHLYQSPPIRPADPVHRSTSPSTWFEGLGPPI